MLNFNGISDRLYYYVDNIRANKLNAKIERFKFDHAHNHILVIYRLGRKKLFHKMDILHFEQNYFNKLSHYDQHRLTKFSTIQHILQSLFHKDLCKRNELIKFIKDETANEQLF